METNSVYFRKLNINESTGSATIIASDVPLIQKATTLAGVNVATRTQNNITFGVLSLIDPETGQVMRSDHPTIKQLSAKLNRGDEMKGFKLSDNPVLNLTTGEESGMFWIEAV
jgi:bifunctional N-acetylglucosamine-1-phosphate-uridyltransferase/glucosamine-1-phosphate-acetyltransferase GlmU-like protein